MVVCILKSTRRRHGPILDQDDQLFFRVEVCRRVIQNFRPIPLSTLVAVDEHRFLTPVSSRDCDYQ